MSFFKTILHGVEHPIDSITHALAPSHSREHYKSKGFFPDLVHYGTHPGQLVQVAEGEVGKTAKFIRQHPGESIALAAGALAIAATAGLAAPEVIGAEAAILGTEALGAEAIGAELGAVEMVPLLAEESAASGAAQLGATELASTSRLVPVAAEEIGAAERVGALLPSEVGQAARTGARYGAPAYRYGQKAYKVAQVAGAVSAVGSAAYETIHGIKGYNTQQEVSQLLSKYNNNEGAYNQDVSTLAGRYQQLAYDINQANRLKQRYGDLLFKTEEHNRDRTAQHYGGGLRLKAEKSHNDDLKEFLGHNEGETEANKQSQVILDTDLQKIEQEEIKQEDALLLIHTSLNRPTTAADFINDINSFDLPASIKEYLASNITAFQSLSQQDRNRVLDAAINKGALN